MRHEQHTLQPSRTGVLYVSAWAVDLRVRFRHLEITARTGREELHGRFARVGRPRLRRLVISTKGGATSWEAADWCRGAGIGLLVLNRSGRTLLSSGERTNAVPQLRR